MSFTDEQTPELRKYEEDFSFPMMLPSHAIQTPFIVVKCIQRLFFPMPINYEEEKTPNKGLISGS